jgi:hypothetical protein
MDTEKGSHGIVGWIYSMRLVCHIGHAWRHCVRSSGTTLLGTLFLIGVLCVGPVSAANIASHRGAYELTLQTTSADSDVASVSGGMKFEWTDKCDAWEVKESYLMRVLRQTSSEVDFVAEYVGWESKDGLRYRFQTKRREAGQIVVVRGNAWLTEVGGPGIAEFEEPRKETFVLPAGTVFPTGHTLILIDKAAREERFDQSLFFDGSEVEGPIPVSAVLLKAQAANPSAVIAKDDSWPSLLLDLVWPMTVAFFESAESDASAQFELQMVMQANGVATSIVLDYGDFKVDGKLTRLEPVQEAGC